jgi:hypothetical protein
MVSTTALVPDPVATSRPSWHLPRARVRAALGVLSALTALGIVATVLAASPVSTSLDVNQGFAFDASRRTSYGVVRAMSLDSTALAADLVSSDATQQPIGAVDTVGVISAINWQGDALSPLTMQVMVSSANKQRLEASLNPTSQQTLQTTKVAQLAFWIVGYDQEQKGWYKAASPLNNGVLRGVVSSMAIGAQADQITSSPTHWPVTITIAPVPNLQQAIVVKQGATLTPAIVPWGQP